MRHPVKTSNGTRGRLAALRAGLLVSVAFGLGALSGCASVYKAEAPVIVAPEAAVPVAPDFAEYAPAALPRVDWVQSFGDARLTELVNASATSNPNIRASFFAVEAAAAGVDQADSARLPDVGVSAGVSRRQRFQNGSFTTPDGIVLPSTQPLGQTNFSLGLNAQWEPDFWGRVRDRIEAAELDVVATEADLASAALSVAGQVSQTYFALIEARKLVALSERDVETQERFLRLTERRFESGLTGASDVRLARSAVASSEALQATRLQIVGDTARRLEVLLRQYPSDTLDAPAEFPPLPVLEGAGTPEQVLQRRPDLIAQEARLFTQGIQVDLARKALLPQLSLSGGLNEGIVNLNQLFDIESIVGTLASNLSAPLFNNGRLVAGVDRQEAVLRQGVERYASAALTAFREIEDALAAETRLAEREAALERSLQESRAAEERLELRYTEGLASILQLLDAQSRALSAEGQLISARAERLQNRVRLHVALGGGGAGQGAVRPDRPDATLGFITEETVGRVPAAGTTP